MQVTGRLVAGAIFLSVVVLFLVLKLIPFDKTDIYILLKAFFALGAAFTLYKYGVVHSGKNGGNKTAVFFMGIAAWIGASIACVILLNHGFRLFHLAQIEKALLFFWSSILMFFVLSFVSDLTGRQAVFAAASYKPHPVKLILLKLAAALVLSCLGVYFMKENKAFFALVSFVFVIIQLMLVLRPVKGPADAVSAYAGDEPGMIFKVLSLVMMGLAFYFYYLALFAMQKYNINMAVILLFAGAFLYGFAPAGSSYGRPAVNVEGGNRFDIYYCVFIFIAGLLIFGYRIMDIPPGIHGDETLSVTMAKRLARGDILPVVLETPEYNGMSLLYYWTLAMLGKVFGITLEMVRWFSVFTGAAGLVFAYLLAKEIFNRRAAVVSSLLLATFFMMVFYSRNALLWIHVPVFAAAAYYFFFRGMKTGRPGFFIAAGVGLSFSLSVYSAGKPAPFVLALWILFMFIRKETRGQIVQNWKNIALMLVTAFLIFLPVINYIIHNPDKYFMRMSNVTFLHGIPTTYNEYKALADNILNNIQMFITDSADGYCHNLPGKPFFDGFISFMAITGAGYILFTWKRESSFFVMLWLFFGLLPGFLSHLGPEDPYPARTVLSIPAVILLVAIGLERSVAKIESLWPKFLKIAGVLVIAYFVAWFSYQNLRNYFVVFANDPHTIAYYRSLDKLTADYMTKHKDNRIIVTPYLSWNFFYGMSDLLSPPKINTFVHTKDLSLFEVFNVYDNAGRDTTLIGEGIYYRHFPIYKEYFPNASIRVIWDPLFWQLDYGSNIKYCYEWKDPDRTITLNRIYSFFYMWDNDVKYVKTARVEIPGADQKAVFSLRAVFALNGKSETARNVVFPLSGADPAFDTAVITGLIDVPDYGRYSLKINGARASIYVNEKQVADPVELYKGLHRIRIVLGAKNGKEVTFAWKKHPDGVMLDVERRYYINSEKLFGLMAEYKKYGRTIYRQLEPAVDYRLYYYNLRPAGSFVDDSMYDVEWSGKIRIGEKGAYSFRLHTLYDAVIYIDGMQVYKKTKDDEAVRTVELAPGTKTVRISSPYRYISNYWDPGSTIRFMYKKPGHMEYGPVTYDMLSPGF